MLVPLQHSSLSSNVSVEEEIPEEIESERLQPEEKEEPKGGMVNAMKEKFKSMLDHA